MRNVGMAWARTATVAIALAKLGGGTSFAADAAGVINTYADIAHAGYEDALQFPLVAALFGRRARRFSLGATLPDGLLAYISRHDPLPLSELERMMVLTAAAGNTGWHYLITRHAGYAPHLSNYSGAAGGRTFPSAAGFHTSELFFTDDDSVYHFATRDAPALVEPDADGSIAPASASWPSRAPCRKTSFAPWP